MSSSTSLPIEASVIASIDSNIECCVTPPIPTSSSSSSSSQQPVVVDMDDRSNNDINKDISVISANSHIPNISALAVLGESSMMPVHVPHCRGYDFEIHRERQERLWMQQQQQQSASKNDKQDVEQDQSQQQNQDQEIDDCLHHSNQPQFQSDPFIMMSELEIMMKSFVTTGFQATNMGLAVEQIRQMRAWRMSDTIWQDGIDDPALKELHVRQRIRARLFLAYTSNQISSGQREVIRFLVQHKMVDVLITTAGGVEEDIIKCFQPTLMGDFSLSGRELRKKGINRIGNLLIPNKNYCDFEDWVSPLIHRMHDEQDQASIKWAKMVASMTTDQIQKEGLPERFAWSPSQIIRRLGLEVNHPDSVLYWAAKNNIPIFCPALTDGSLGDMLYFHSYKRAGFLLDIQRDLRRLNDLAVRSHCTGQIILGGGVVKHHCCNANLMRNGADYSVYINTAADFDGSDSGASPDEAISWGKIRITAQPVKVMADATLVFPLLVATTFARNVEEWKEQVQGCVCYIDDIDDVT